MYKKPILSICIPTKNRADILEGTIQSIITQEPFLQGEVEVVISDNASEDDTEQIMMKYAEKYEGIQYFRNSQDIGATQNFAIAMQRGRGLYRKLMNDTVRYKLGALAEMAMFVKKNQDKRPALGWKIYHMRERQSADYAVVTNWDTFFRIPSYWLTWISTHGIWEDDSDTVVEHAISASNNFLKRIKDKEAGDMLVKCCPYEPKEDPFWQLRCSMQQYEKRGKMIFSEMWGNWNICSVKKDYSNDKLRWTFYDYYMDILRKNRDKELISQGCIDELERDLGLYHLWLRLQKKEIRMIWSWVMQMFLFPISALFMRINRIILNF